MQKLTGDNGICNIEKNWYKWLLTVLKQKLFLEVCCELSF